PRPARARRRVHARPQRAAEERLSGREQQPHPRVPHAVDLPARPRAQPGLGREPSVARQGPGNDGFVLASGPGAMGYWDEDDMPFSCGMARTFPVCDRFFSSCLAQTYPNRKFLMCGTAVGQVSTDISQVGKAPPPNGTIFERLNLHGISWRNYFT